MSVVGNPFFDHRFRLLVKGLPAEIPSPPGPLLRMGRLLLQGLIGAMLLLALVFPAVIGGAMLFRGVRLWHLREVLAGSMMVLVYAGLGRSLWGRRSQGALPK